MGPKKHSKLISVKKEKSEDERKQNKNRRMNLQRVEKARSADKDLISSNEAMELLADDIGNTQSSSGQQHAQSGNSKNSEGSGGSASNLDDDSMRVKQIKAIVTTNFIHTS
ncbi:hypothetical protein QAD02_000518 [Eretmocerus hayati]|uniref:Uncharacterized protein n=1 Tax=Eretmocerus hayati TaxID=131215 RepID=A0ACC2NFY9_9HYME|nr:hypothetical protein QAD02_000518 [Eretmocerus hayati]